MATDTNTSTRDENKLDVSTPRPSSPKPSVHSRASSKRSCSSRSSVMEATAKARAIAEAALTKASYAKRQLEMKKERAKLDLQKAALEADLEALAYERDAEAARVEAEVLEAAVAGMGNEDVQSLKSVVPPQVIQRCTEEYVQSQSEISVQSSALLHHGEMQYTVNSPPSQLAPGAVAVKPPLSVFRPSAHEPAYAAEQPPTLKQSHSPHRQHGQHLPFSPDYPPMIDFAKFLARKELVTTGLTKFDDSPENFRSWQSTFFNATQDLGLTHSEELDLLVKWLGKESSEHVKRIRAVHVTDPIAALHLSWQRLQECYGAPEMVENALFNRLDSFPRLSATDNLKLRELSDLLMELLAAKNDGYLPGLAYLDTSRGIKPIVEKLPPGLQEKWLTTGSRYKEQHRVTFPPFSFFVDFVDSQAKARNDPSFALSGISQSYYKCEKNLYIQSGSRTAVSVHKTDVSATTDADATSDPARYCPLHKKMHPLDKCRLFQMKTLQERRDILKEHKRCFKCCAPNHLAKDCQTTLKCSECESDKHCSAMHPNMSQPLPQLSTPPYPEAQPASFPLEVTSQCTKVCGLGSPRSCSKICLTRVFPQGQPERAIKVYVMLDDQSNRSLACSKFFQLFGVDSSLSPYLMRTCAGTTEMTGRKAVGFQIEAVNGGVCLDLPPLIECNEILSNKSEVPTPEVALAHAHLRHIAPDIPKLDPDAQMMILLGRDMIRVHKVREQVNGPHDAPFAQRLDLGWVIIGEVCLDAHKPTVNTFRTHILQNGRPSFLIPCHSNNCVKERLSYGGEHRCGHSAHMTYHLAEEQLGLKVFQKTDDDNKRAMSFEDDLFLNFIEKEVHQDEKDNRVAPLPFKSPRPPLPNNREQALSHLSSLRRTLNKTTSPDEYAALQANKETSSSSQILTFDPYMSDGLLREGTEGAIRAAVPGIVVLLSSTMLLTQMPGLHAPPGDFTSKDLLKVQTQDSAQPTTGRCCASEAESSTKKRVASGSGHISFSEQQWKSPQGRTADSITRHPEDLHATYLRHCPSLLKRLKDGLKRIGKGYKKWV